MRKKTAQKENYLEKTPLLSTSLEWSEEDGGLVTLHVQNKGFFKRLTQILIKKPKVSHIHLDEFGSFIWLAIDGEKNLFKIGEELEEHFGDKAKPTYERLSQYFRMLENYKFIVWKNTSI